MEQEIQLLKDYTHQEKTAYLGAIASVTSADRVASDEEIEYLKALSESAGLSQEDELQVLRAAKDSTNASLQANLNSLKDSQLKYSLITDIISFAKADGKYSSTEEASIEKIANYLNINQDQFNALSQTADKVSQGDLNEESIQNNFFGSNSGGGGGGIGSMLSKVGISPNILTGSLSMLAPLILSKIMGRRGGMGGGLLGGLLGGAMGGQRKSNGGGLGSLLGMLTGGRGYSGMGSMGGLGGLLSGKGF